MTTWNPGDRALADATEEEARAAYRVWIRHVGNSAASFRVALNGFISSRRAAIPETTREEPAQVRPGAAAPAHAFKAGDRVRVKAEYRHRCVFKSGEFVRLHSAKAEFRAAGCEASMHVPLEWLEVDGPAAPSPSPPKVEEAKERVCAEFMKMLTPEGHLCLARQTYSDAYPAVAALLALRAAREPVVKRDAVGEAEAAFDALDKELRSAPGAAMDRLRAALARLRETGR